MLADGNMLVFVPTIRGHTHTQTLLFVLSLNVSAAAFSQPDSSPLSKQLESVQRTKKWLLRRIRKPLPL